MVLRQEAQVNLEKSNIYKCPKNYCPIAFLDSNDLPNHIKRHEEAFLARAVSAYVKVEKLKIFICDDCQKCFLSRNKFLLHRQKHDYIFVKDINENHRTNGRIKRFKCPKCDFKFVAKSTLEAHSVYHQPFPYNCFCGIGFYQLQDLQGHQKLVHNIQNTENKKQNGKNIKKSSEKETKVFDNTLTHSPKLNFRRNLTTHPPLDVEFERKNGKYQCPDCDKTLCSKAAAETHFRSIHRGERPYICKICNKAFTQHSALNNHLLIHAGARNFACQYCNKGFLNYAAQMLHERIHTGFKPYKCHYCEKTFSDPSAYKRHLRIHTGDKKYVCPYCPKAFTDSSALYVHRKRHTQERNHNCKKCGKKFYTKSDFLKHYETVHNYKHDFECDYCHKTCSSKINIAEHILRVHCKRTKKYSCDLCFKRFITMKNLDLHKNVVHYSKRDIKCEICNRRFTQKYMLEHHIAVHSGVKKFECAYCSRKHYNKRDLRGHIMTHHMPKYKCELCKRIFPCKRYLKQHKLEVAERCDICGLEFICHGELELHHNKTHVLKKKRRN